MHLVYTGWDSNVSLTFFPIQDNPEFILLSNKKPQIADTNKQTKQQQQQQKHKSKTSSLAFGEGCFLAFVSSLFTIFEFVTCHLSWGTSLAESKCHTLLFSPAGELLGLWIAVEKNCFLWSFGSAGSAVEASYNCLNSLQWRGQEE